MGYKYGYVYELLEARGRTNGGDEGHRACAIDPLRPEALKDRILANGMR